MVSMNDVAARANVSVGTVSKFLNTPRRVAPDTSQRIHSAISELGYVRNEAARQLKAGTSRTLALVALELNNPFFGEVAEALEYGAAEAGLFLSIVSSRGDAAREGEYIESFVEQRVYGVILASGLTQERHLALLHDRHVPTVLMDAWGASDRFSSTSIDDFAGGKAAVAHLIEQGARHILFVGADDHIHQIRARQAGAVAAAEEVPGVRLEIISTVERTVLAGRATGELLLARSSDNRPDGVFAANDSLAIGVLEAITSDGRLSIPGDIAVVGYDDIDYAESAAVPLTSVRRPRRSFGRSAMNLINEQAKASEPHAIATTVLQPRLIPRASTLRRPSAP